MTRAHGFVDITYKVAYEDMTAKIAINRPHLHNAFRPITVNEMRRAFDLAQDDRCGNTKRCFFFVCGAFFLFFGWSAQSGVVP